MWSDRCLGTFFLERGIRRVTGGENRGAAGMVIWKPDDRQESGPRDSERGHAFVLANRLMLGAYLTPETLCGSPPSMQPWTPWPPAEGSPHSQPSPVPRSQPQAAASPTCCSQVHAFAHPGPSVWNTLGPSALVLIHPIIQGCL